MKAKPVSTKPWAHAESHFLRPALACAGIAVPLALAERRILRGMGKPEEAVAAYRHAMTSLQTIRKEMTVCTGDSSFRKTATQLCSQYVDLLLEVAASMDNPSSTCRGARGP